MGWKSLGAIYRLLGQTIFWHPGNPNSWPGCHNKVWPKHPIPQGLPKWQRRQAAKLCNGPKSLPTAPHSWPGSPNLWAPIWEDHFHGREILNKSTLAQYPYQCGQLYSLRTKWCWPSMGDGLAATTQDSRTRDVILKRGGEGEGGQKREVEVKVQA